MQLSTHEIDVFHRLQRMKPAGILGSYIAFACKKPTAPNVRRLILTLLEQYQDNPKLMDRALGFDLPKLLNVKLYTVEALNKQLSDMGYAYRATGTATATSKDAQWMAQSGYFSLPDGAGTVYVDNRLNRYIRLSNGQLFACTNADLVGMPDRDKQNILSYLSGLID
jgi:hypothetical protein